ncbi:MAG: hypothetical protein JXA93_16460 [Anaerolineae bacterium]|nr:hypothetical protein [Anaerolineae bacterium]
MKTTGTIYAQAKGLLAAYAAGDVPLYRVGASIQGWVNHAATATRGACARRCWASGSSFRQAGPRPSLRDEEAVDEIRDGDCDNAWWGAALPGRGKKDGPAWSWPCL